jgi:hypothetical protein
MQTVPMMMAKIIFRKPKKAFDNFKGLRYFGEYENLRDTLVNINQSNYGRGRAFGNGVRAFS